MIPDIWNKESYKAFIEYLISIKDSKYKEFHSSIVLNSKYEIIGIRVLWGSYDSRISNFSYKRREVIL